MKLSAKDREAVLRWFANGRTGASSTSLAREAVGFEHERHIHYPHDGGDLGRCLALIETAPGVRAAVDALAAKSPYWAKLAPEWDRLAAMQKADDPGIYKAMQDVLRPVEDADRHVVRLGDGITVRFGR